MASSALLIFTLLFACQSVYCRKYAFHQESYCAAYDLAPGHLTFGRPAPPAGGNWKEIVCYDSNAVDIRSIVDVIRQAKYISRSGQNLSVSFADMAPLITQVWFQAAGNVTISASSLRELPKLNSLYLAHRPDNQDAHLNIDLSAIANLTMIGLDGFFLKDNSIQAISSLKDRLLSFDLRNCQPSDEVLKLPEKLTKIDSLEIACNDTNSSPVRKFNQLSKKLKHIRIDKCNLQKISSTMFREMKNLTYLSLDKNFITTVEERAFDDLVNLEHLSLMDNNIASLPNVLFGKTAKLCRVVLIGNSVANPYTDKDFEYCRHA